MKQFLNVTLFVFICLCGFVQPISILANEIEPQSITEPRADIIEWRYKIENGKLYKRLFNYSKNKWVGDWILVG